MPEATLDSAVPQGSLLEEQRSQVQPWPFLAGFLKLGGFRSFGSDFFFPSLSMMSQSE